MTERKQTAQCTHEPPPEAVRLTLPYPPSANRYWRQWKGRQLVSEEARAYKKAIGWLAKAAGVKLLSGNVRLWINVYRPRRAGDLDNRLKILLDGLEGVAFADDEQVEFISLTRFEDPKRPRVEITLASAL